MSMPLAGVAAHYNCLTVTIVHLYNLFESTLSHKYIFKYLGLYTHDSYFLERNVQFGLKLFENFSLVLHEEFKANIRLTLKNSLKTKIFYALPLSFKILLNLCSFLIVNKKQFAKY